MHEALDCKNLKRLPLSIRFTANSAVSANRKIEDLERLQAYSVTASATQCLLLLPVVYINLDTADIPDPGVFDAEPTHALVAAIYASATGRAVVALDILCTIQLPPEAEGLGADLWPRVLAWAQWIDNNGHYLADTPFCLSILSFADVADQNLEMSKLITSEPWIWSMVGRAWAHLPGLTNTHDRLATVGRLQYFLSHDGLGEPQSFAEVLDGLGGTLSELGRLTVHLFDELVPAAHQPMDMPYLGYLNSAFLLVGNVELALSDGGSKDREESCSGFRKSLLSHQFVRVLLRAMCSLSNTRSEATLFLLRRCFKRMNILLMTPVGFTSLPAALDDGLLRVVVLCALSPFAHDLQEQFEKYLVHWFPPCLHNYSFVSALDAALHGTADLVNTDAFKSSEIRRAWDTFLNIARSSLEILRVFDARPASSVLKACDNLECLKIDAKITFKRCSGCRSCYYCSRACQTSDWQNGHRLVCDSYGTLTLSERNVNSFTTRQRSFLRTLVDTAYARNRRAIFMQHATSIKNEHTTFVVYDYSAGAVKIRFKSTIGLPQLDGPEWEDLM
ncbi:MYND-type domain-containing protein, partial [Favolaschia claudopus]